MMRTSGLMIVMVGMLGLMTVSQGWAGEAPAGRQVVGLRDCIEKALATAPELGEADADIELTTAKLDEAKAHRYPQLDILGLAGPVPQARQNPGIAPQLSPDNNSRRDHWTWFGKGDATLVQPLYTFGKISENMKAASHGIEVDRAKKEQRRNEIALKVKEYYYGILLARELKELVMEVQEDLGKARTTARKLLDKGSDNVDETDIFKLESYEGEAKNYLEEAKKGEELALAALRVRLGLPASVPLDIATERLVPEEVKAADLAAYLEISRARRPEYRQIREGLMAREALVEAARAAYYPDIFAGAQLSAAWAEKRDRASNPWIQDEFNHFWAGVALGIKWHIDFGITRAKVAEEVAQYNRLQSTSQFAEANIPLQIQRSYLDLQAAEKSIATSKEAYASSKKWTVASLANYDFGVGPSKDIFDGLQQYAKMRTAYFQAIYNQKMALANLSYATGEEPAAGK